MAIIRRAFLAPVALLAAVSVSALSGCQTAEKGFQEACTAAGHRAGSPEYRQCVNQERRTWQKQNNQHFYRSSGGGP